MAPFPTSPARPLRPFTAGLLASVAISVARANLLFFLGLLLLSTAVRWASAELARAALGLFLEGREDAVFLETRFAKVQLFALIPYWIFGILLTTAACHRTVRFLEGTRAPNLESLKRNVLRLPTVAGICFVTHLPLLLARLLPALGYHTKAITEQAWALLFLLSGFLLQLLFFVAVPVAVIEASGAARCLARSLSLVKGGWFPIFLCSLGLFLLLCFCLPLAHPLVNRPSHLPVLLLFIELPVFLIYHLLPGVAYFLLRQRKEEVPAAEHARTFA